MTTFGRGAVGPPTRAARTRWAACTAARAARMITSMAERSTTAAPTAARISRTRSASYTIRAPDGGALGAVAVDGEAAAAAAAASSFAAAALRWRKPPPPPLGPAAKDEAAAPSELTMHSAADAGSAMPLPMMASVVESVAPTSSDASPPAARRRGATSNAAFASSSASSAAAATPPSVAKVSGSCAPRRTIASSAACSRAVTSTLPSTLVG